MFKVLIAAIRLNVVEHARLWALHINYWHLNASLFNIIEVDWFKEVMLFDLVDTQSLLAISNDQTSDQTLGRGGNLDGH